MDEIYVSTDVETDGPIPGDYSMLSFGSAAFLADKTLLGTFSANLRTLAGAHQDPRVMEWWQTEAEAWQAHRQDLQEPAAAMQAYLAWLQQLPGKPVFVGFPAAYDFMFIAWYLVHFTGENPFRHVAIDTKTYAMAVLKIPYRETGKSNLPPAWFDPSPHTHQALDDAIEQGQLFINMLTANHAR